MGRRRALLIVLGDLAALLGLERLERRLDRRAGSPSDASATVHHA